MAKQAPAPYEIVERDEGGRVVATYLSEGGSRVDVTVRSNEHSPYGLQ